MVRCSCPDSTCSVPLVKNKQGDVSEHHRPFIRSRESSTHEGLGPQVYCIGCERYCTAELQDSYKNVSPPGVAFFGSYNFAQNYYLMPQNLV